MADTASLRDAPERNLAFLFDGDNAQLSLIGDVLAQAVKYGTTTACRIYGDWTTPNMSGWKTALQNHAFQPQQQFRYTSCKNATDSALIIEAMGLLHSGGFEADFRFCSWVPNFSTMVELEGLNSRTIHAHFLGYSFPNSTGISVQFHLRCSTLQRRSPRSGSTHKHENDKRPGSSDRSGGRVACLHYGNLYHALYRTGTRILGRN